jgi:DUF1680 family protein
MHLPITQRLEVFGCSCCPPNVLRYVTSIADFLYTRKENTLFVHHYMASETKTTAGIIRQMTQYPYQGRVEIELDDAEIKTLALRIPGWCDHYTCNVPVTEKDGYAYIDEPTEVVFDFEMKPAYYSAHAEVDESAGKVALARGPIVYCAERVDNPLNMHRLLLLPEMNATLEEDTLTGQYAITVDALLSSRKDGTLFQKVDNVYEKTRVRFIPYYAFANRGETDMLVWFRYKD